MSNDIEAKRKALMDAYPYSAGWQEKVKKMSDKQIVAVYLRLKVKNKSRSFHAHPAQN